MATLRVEVTSRETMKPSSPTPPYLKTVQLSFLDQFAPTAYIPLIYFYQNDPTNPNMNTQQTTLLKKTLSQTLVHFYPLAGRVDNNTSIDCNDEGVEFYEANVCGNLLEFIENPDLEDLEKLLPFQPNTHDKSIVLGVQVNHFPCGGMALGVCISHKIADGIAFVSFVNAWATISAQGFRGNGDEPDHVVPHQVFDGASYFRPRDVVEKRTAPPAVAICDEKIVTKRFVFAKRMLVALKEKVANSIHGAQVKDPTKVEVISSFIWKHVMEAALVTNPSLDGIFAAGHSINLRTRMTPPIPESSFGNFWWVSIMPFSIGVEPEHPKLVCLMRDGIKKLDNSLIKRLQAADGESRLLEMSKVYEGITELCRFSTWCRFPLYDADFGWGKPIWVCPTPVPFKNMVILFSTKCGEGIEAWVNMLEGDVSILEREILSLFH